MWGSACAAEELVLHRIQVRRQRPRAQRHVQERPTARVRLQGTAARSSAARSSSTTGGSLSAA